MVPPKSLQGFGIVHTSLIDFIFLEPACGERNTVVTIFVWCMHVRAFSRARVLPSEFYRKCTNSFTVHVSSYVYMIKLEIKLKIVTF